MATSADVSQLAAKVYLNDSQQEMWTDTLLFPIVGRCILELEQAIRENEIPFERKAAAVVPVLINATTLTSLPVDFIEVISFWERARNSTENWIEIFPVDDIDVNLLLADRIIQWSFQRGVININPPQTEREVQLDYTATLTRIVSSASVIDLAESLDFLAARTAQIAADNIGHNPSKAENIRIKYADPAREIMINTLLKNTQGLGVRRLPYRGRRRV